MSPRVPDKPSLDGLEDKWSSLWEANGTYRFDRSAARPKVFSIDTPPPTISGTLHVGSAMAYSQADAIARYKRMRGYEVFYPMGWDDNGVPTERRVQNYFGVRCDPSLPYDPTFEPPASPPPDPIHVSRPNFVELCYRLTAADEKAFESVWRALGLAVDWSMTYTTIGEKARRASQRSFLRLLAKGRAYMAEAPTLWDVDFGMAVSQAELEDREVPGAYYRVRFWRPGGEAVEIDTTRPELIPACVALVAHPEDSRYRHLFGSKVLSPLFKAPVPVLAHALADPEKGTGIAMVCTFGDLTDVVWWRELGLAVKPVMGRDGRIEPVPWGEEGWETEDVESARRHHAQLAGLSAEQARQRIAQLLASSGELVGEARPITHPVKYYERGERPLEIVTTRQWFVRTLDMKERLIELGRQLEWHPPHMRARYESWVEGLNSDWNISRQRYFGVPFPVWYPLDDQGRPCWSSPILASEESLPVDPSTDAPPGFSESQRGQPGGFVGDPDVMDTWATSSLTPLIASGWEDDLDLFPRVYPMDLRPQGHDIIRTWLFTTVLRSELEHGRLPWTHAMINGWVLDPDRKKMSKSKGNVVTPMDHIRSYGADALRYWASSGRPGVDTAFDEGQLRIGRRLAIKILNVSRFVISRLASSNDEPIAPPDPGQVSFPLDAALLARLADIVDEATGAMESYDYARALERTEAFFWSFCDDYVELVKGRAYGTAGEGGAASAKASLQLALSTLLRLFAPHLPFVTEEVWSWWQDGSVHRAGWPSGGELRRAAGGHGDPSVLEVAAEVLSRLRRAKTEAKLSMRAPVARLEVVDTAERIEALKAAQGELAEAGVLQGPPSLLVGEPSSVSVELARPA